MRTNTLFSKAFAAMCLTRSSFMDRCPGCGLWRYGNDDPRWRWDHPALGGGGAGGPLVWVTSCCGHTLHYDDSYYFFPKDKHP